MTKSTVSPLAVFDQCTRHSTTATEVVSTEDNQQTENEQTSKTNFKLPTLLCGKDGLTK